MSNPIKIKLNDDFGITYGEIALSKPDSIIFDALKKAGITLYIEDTLPDLMVSDDVTGIRYGLFRGLGWTTQIIDGNLLTWYSCFDVPSHIRSLEQVPEPLF